MRVELLWLHVGVLHGELLRGSLLVVCLVGRKILGVDLIKGRIIMITTWLLQ